MKNQTWNLDSIGIAGVAEAGDSFGNALVVGDFNGYGKDFLAINLPFEIMLFLVLPGVQAIASNKRHQVHAY